MSRTGTPADSLLFLGSPSRDPYIAYSHLGCSPFMRLFSSLLRKLLNPTTAALTTFTALSDPSDLDRISFIPAASHNALIGPPAITPAPGAAGFNNTFPAPYLPITS